METEIKSYLPQSSVKGKLDNKRLRPYNQESVSVRSEVTELADRKVVVGLPQPEARRRRIESHTVPKGPETQL
jgi:hypothetical protein